MKRTKLGGNHNVFSYNPSDGHSSGQSDIGLLYDGSVGPKNKDLLVPQVYLLSSNYQLYI